MAHAEQIEGVKTVLDFEPDSVDRKNLPLISMFFLLPESFDTATGPTEDLDYRWEISLYVALSSAREAQGQIKVLSKLLVDNFRAHRSDYDLNPTVDMFVRTLRRRVPPTPGEGYMRGSWELAVTCGEQ